jgi:hypothetical protein
MVAINFKKQFADLVESCKKRQTIRETTKAMTGTKLQLYYGQRTKQCRKVMDAICTATCQIRVRRYDIWTTRDGDIEDIESFARKDGFTNFEEMWKFFADRADECGEFHGWLIEW